MDFVKAFLSPLPATMLVMAALLVATRKSAPRRLWLLSATLWAVTYLGSVRTVSNGLYVLVQDGCPLTLPASGSVDAVLVLGGGLGPRMADGHFELSQFTEARLLLGVRTFRASGAKTLIVSGGATSGGDETEAGVMARQAIAAGIPPDAIVEEANSFNTRDQARELAARFANRPRVALVTTASHMRRARYAFAQTAAELVPVSSGCSTPVSGTRNLIRGFIPSVPGLSASTEAVREATGLVWYRLRDAIGR